MNFVEQIEEYAERRVRAFPDRDPHAVKSGLLLGLFDSLDDMDPNMRLGEALERLMKCRRTKS